MGGIKVPLPEVVVEFADRTKPLCLDRAAAAPCWLDSIGF